MVLRNLPVDFICLMIFGNLLWTNASANIKTQSPSSKTEVPKKKIRCISTATEYCETEFSCFTYVALENAHEVLQHGCIADGTIKMLMCQSTNTQPEFTLKCCETDLCNKNLTPTLLPSTPAKPELANIKTQSPSSKTEVPKKKIRCISTATEYCETEFSCFTYVALVNAHEVLQHGCIADGTIKMLMCRSTNTQPEFTLMCCETDLCNKNLTPTLLPSTPAKPELANIKTQSPSSKTEVPKKKIRCISTATEYCETEFSCFTYVALENAHEVLQHGCIADGTIKMLMCRSTNTQPEFTLKCCETDLCNKNLTPTLLPSTPAKPELERAGGREGVFGANGTVGKA